MAGLTSDMKSSLAAPQFAAGYLGIYVCSSGKEQCSRRHMTVGYGQVQGGATLAARVGQSPLSQQVVDDRRVPVRRRHMQGRFSCLPKHGGRALCRNVRPVAKEQYRDIQVSVRRRKVQSGPALPGPGGGCSSEREQPTAFVKIPLADSAQEFGMNSFHRIIKAPNRLQNRWNPVIPFLGMHFISLAPIGCRFRLCERPATNQFFTCHRRQGDRLL